MDTELLINLRLHLQNTPIEKLREEWADVEEIFYDVVNDNGKVNELNKAAVIKCEGVERKRLLLAYSRFYDNKYAKNRLAFHRERDVDDFLSKQ